MKPSPVEGPKDVPCDPIRLNIAVSKLEVYRHERLAYTDLPARKPEPNHPAANRFKRFLVAIGRWVLAR